MRKRLSLMILILCLLTTTLFTGSAARADDGELPDPGLTPDSPFYFIDSIGKQIEMFFTFGADAKARKALEFAEERLAETRLMAAGNRLREMEKAASDYDRYMNMCRERLDEVNQSGIAESIAERIALATTRHIEILDGVIDDTPVTDTEVIQRARLASQNGQVNALRRLGEVQPERAVEIAESTINNRLERARARTQANNAADVTEILDYAVRLAEVEDEITEANRRAYTSVDAINQDLSNANANRDAIISDIMPESSLKGVRGGLEGSLDMYQDTIDQLMNRGEVTEVANQQTAVQRLQNRLMENNQIATSNQQQVRENTSDNTSAQTQTRPVNEVSNR